MIRQPYAQLIEMKCWADRGLCQAVRESLPHLGPQETGILVQIFDHIHAVDRIFQHHLQGIPHSYTAARSEVAPPLETLFAGMEEVDAWYADHTRGLSAADFEQPIDFVFTSGKPARLRRGEILLHVCLHGTYHRGNAGAVLQLKGLTPAPDGITDFLADAA